MLQGNNVMILASTETYIDNRKLGYVMPGSYITNDGIPITRIPYKKFLPHFIMKKLRIYSGINLFLEDFQPDVIFLHNCQFLSISKFVYYKKKHPSVKIYVDSHTDLINSARGWVSKNILHKIIYKYCVKRIEKYVIKFYGTLPIRNDFLIKIYNVNSNKIELLPFGIDDSLFKWEDRDSIREIIRKKLGIDFNDFVIITGGKIDKRKNIHHLLKSFIDIKDSETKNSIKLIVFGKPDQELDSLIKTYVKHPNIIYLEWISSIELYKYFFASDLAIFPGTHSVLWEEAVGSGLPCIFYEWDGMKHIDIGGNCLFIKDGKDEEEIKRLLLKIINDKLLYNKMKEIAFNEGPKMFSYSKIAKQALSG